MSSSWRYALVAGFSVLVVVVVFAAFYWAQTDGPSRTKYGNVGVARSADGHVEVMVTDCYPGISELEIVNDTVVTDPLRVVLSAANPERDVSVSAADHGYSYSGPLVDPASVDEMRVRVLVDANGVNRITKKPLTWRSSELSDGFVLMADGTQAPLDGWRARGEC